MTAEKQIALVTGASRGIGAATLEKLAKANFTIYGTATSDAGVEKITAKIKELNAEGSGILYRATEDTDYDNLLKELPAVDVLVCNAGITKDGLFIRMGVVDLQEVIDVNLTAPFKLAKMYVRGMMKKRFGRIIMVSSVVAKLGNAGQANYVASKAGIEGLVRTLANEFGSRGITVNAVAPGFIDTDMTKDVFVDKLKEDLLKLIPLNRTGQPAEVAAIIAFLASNDAAYITGATIPVNGGLLMS